MNPSSKLSEAVEQYLIHLQAQGKSKATLYTYGMDLKQVLAYFGPDKTVQSITLPQVGKFYRSDILLKLPNGQYRADQTIRKTARVFRMLILWLQEQGIIEIAPLPKQIPHLLPEATISQDKQLDPTLSESL
jgi:hypothetical protein